jgi:hypothetical protein
MNRWPTYIERRSSGIDELSKPAVTLGIYTQAIRGGDVAAEVLEKAYIS